MKKLLSNNGFVGRGDSLRIVCVWGGGGGWRFPNCLISFP